MVDLEQHSEKFSPADIEGRIGLYRCSPGQLNKAIAWLSERSDRAAQDCLKRLGLELEITGAESKSETGAARLPVRMETAGEEETGDDTNYVSLESMALLAPKGKGKKPKYIREEVSSADLKLLKPLKKTRAELVAIKREINREGTDAKKMCVDLMKKHRVLGLGEIHEDDSPMRRFGKELVSDLKAAKATHFVIEVPKTSQKGVDRELDKYIKTGKFDLSKLPARCRSKEYIDLLKSAKLAGLRIVCGDKDTGTLDPARDRTMADTIAGILKESKDNKVVCWFGSRHLCDGYRPSSPVKWAAEILKERKISMATVCPVMDKEETLGVLTRGLTRPVGLAMKSTPKVGKLTESIDPRPDTPCPRYEHWSHVIVFPTRK